MFSQIQQRFNISILSESLALNLKEKNNFDYIKFLKCKLGIEIMLINLTKFFVIYGLAVLFNSFYATALFHVSYSGIRINSYGIHAKRSSTCTIVSIFMFIIIPNLIKGFIFPEYIIYLIIIFSYYNIYKYAPANTSKNKINSLELRRKLRLKALLMYTIYTLILLTINSNFIKNQVLIGSFVAVICILPITYKILKEGEMKNEKNI